MAMPSSLASASRGERVRALLLSIARMTVTVVVLLCLYASVPMPTSRQEAFDGLPLFLVALTVFVAVFVWQIRRIRRARHPGLRAIEAGVVSLTVFLVVFASVYLTVDAATSGSFSQPLGHVTAMYFTVTVFSTVGFGDITPTSDPMRVVVAVQMLLDLAFVGVAVRLLFQVAQQTARQRSAPAGGDEGPSIAS
jgi:voltage-gated potassium channel